MDDQEKILKKLIAMDISQMVALRRGQKLLFKLHGISEILLIGLFEGL